MRDEPNVVDEGRRVAASVAGGDISPEVLQSADEAGMRYLFTSEPSLHPHPIGGCWVLGRLGVKADVPAERVRELVAFRGWARAHFERRIKLLARIGMGPLYRMYVERSTRPYVAGDSVESRA